LNQRVFFHEAAEEDLGAALDWYRARSEHAATHFLDEIGHVIERVRQSAQQFPHIVGTARRALLNRFPFALIFRETAGGLEVLAIAHARRRPGYWRNRVPDE
jgi:plasmid stabilization system protein ParE